MCSLHIILILKNEVIISFQQYVETKQIADTIKRYKPISRQQLQMRKQLFLSQLPCDIQTACRKWRFKVQSFNI